MEGLGFLTLISLLLIGVFILFIAAEQSYFNQEAKTLLIGIFGLGLMLILTVSYMKNRGGII